MPASAEIKITRTIEAPVAKVFEAWTDASLLQKWMAPGPYEVREVEVDARPGGTYRMVAASADDGPHITTGEYLEVEPNRRLVQTWVYEGPNAPEKTSSLVTIDFRELGPGTTELTLTHSKLPEGKPEEATSGWNLILNNLEAHFGEAGGRNK